MSIEFIRSIKDRKNPYVQINKQVFDDPNIPLDVKGFIGYCLSKPDNWIFHVRHLTTELKESKNSIYRIIKKCIDSGYAIRWRLRRGDGTFDNWQTLISDSKDEIKRVQEELNQNREIQKSYPLPQNQEVVDRVSEPVPKTPRLDFGTLIRIKESNKNDKEIIIAKPPEAPNPEPPEAPIAAAGYYYCLNEVEGLGKRAKATLSLLPEAIVKRAVAYVNHPQTKVRDGPMGRVKLLQDVLNHPDDYAETLENFDKPKRDRKEIALDGLKVGEKYNKCELCVGETGPYFLHENGCTVYGALWDQPDFEEKWAAIKAKVLEKYEPG